MKAHEYDHVLFTILQRTNPVLGKKQKYGLFT